METKNDSPRYLDKIDSSLSNKSKVAYFAIRDYFNELHAVVHGHLPLDEYNSHYEEIEDMLTQVDDILRKFAKFYYMSNPLYYICATRL